MAGTDRKASPDLTALQKVMEKKPHEFGFFSLLRLIECLYQDKPRLGTSRRPTDDPIRLGQRPEMAFEPATIADFQPREGKAPLLEVRFMGLLGPNGPLPLHLTEYARTRQERYKDRTLCRFLDIFNHRMLSLFYRAWANNDPTVSFDRPDSDHFAGYVGALCGLGQPALRQRDDMPDFAKFYYCGRLSGQSRCAEGLEAIIADYFGVMALIEEFIGEWVTLPEKSICRPGLNQENSILGRSAIAGLKIWSCQHKFRIILGPLDYDDYYSFLPPGARIRGLVALVRNYNGDELAWDIKLILMKEETPATRLNGSFHLGWTTWLGIRPGEEDVDDLILNIQDRMV